MGDTGIEQLKDGQKHIHAMENLFRRCYSTMGKSFELKGEGMSFFGVIADDLTGAMDAGVQMLNKNAKVNLVLAAESMDSVIENTDFVVVNTQSRNASSDTAYHKAAAAVQQFLDNDCSIIYKKIDSTLRGNIGAELKAVLDCAIFDCILIAPALPFNKRTTENGVHFVDGVKLADTELAKDPFAPIYHSAVADIIKEQMNTDVGLISLKEVKKGCLNIAQEISKLVETGTKIIVVDAAAEKHLQAAANGAGLFPGNKMLCGSAGLFQYFDEAYNIDFTYRDMDRSLLARKHSAPILVVSGSPAAMSKQQIRYLAKKRQDVSVISFDITAVSDADVSDRVKCVINEILHNLDNGRHVVLDAAGAGKEVILRQSQGNREKLDYHSSRVFKLVSEVVYAAVSHIPLGALVIFGGDTAVAVTERLGVKGINIMGQIEPYIPHGILSGGAFSGLPIVTKAGGFGKEDSLVRIINSLTRKGYTDEE